MEEEEDLMDIERESGQSEPDVEILALEDEEPAVGELFFDPDDDIEE